MCFILTVSGGRGGMFSVSVVRDVLYGEGSPFKGSVLIRRFRVTSVRFLNSGLRLLLFYVSEVE